MTRHTTIERGAKGWFFPWLVLFIDSKGQPQLVSGVMTQEEDRLMREQLKEVRSDENPTSR